MIMNEGEGGGQKLGLPWAPKGVNHRVYGKRNLQGVRKI